MSDRIGVRGESADRAPLAVAVGDPAGVGPLVSARAALECAGGDRIALFGDAERLSRGLLEGPTAGRADVRRIGPDALDTLEPGSIGCVHVTDWPDNVVGARAPTAEGGRAQLATLDAAVAAVRAGAARALVTGPTSKEAIVRGGTPFVGQTEHLADAAGLPREEVTMMFLGPVLRVALVTTHLAVRDVAAAIAPEGVERTVLHLADALLRLTGPDSPAPRIAVTGLNPHAGEQGLFGDEETRAIVPGIERAARRLLFGEGQVVLQGPVPAETALREAAAGHWEGVVTMMHDQATIASKLLDWETAVNVTWGLPFVRTSVDHGVAYAAAATGTARHEGMVATLRMAQRLSAGEGP